VKETLDIREWAIQWTVNNIVRYSNIEIDVRTNPRPEPSPQLISTQLSKQCNHLLAVADHALRANSWDKVKS